jgi:hypothetical protein
LLIRDDGLGGCTYATAPDTDNQITAYQPCTSLFTGPCAYYDGYLTLVAAYDGGGAYVEPDFQAHLTTIGLGDLTALFALNVYVIQLPPNGAIPTDIQLNFLPGLTYVDFSVVIVECTGEDAVKGGCPDPSSAPSTPRLVGLPALSKVYSLDRLTIQSTALKDMLSFNGLTCLPSRMKITGNLGLATLQGLANLRPWFRDCNGPRIDMTQNAFTTPASVSALQTLALCDNGGASSLLREIAMDVSGCPTSLPVSPQCPYDLVGDKSTSSNLAINSDIGNNTGGPAALLISGLTLHDCMSICRGHPPVTKLLVYHCRALESDAIQPDLCFQCSFSRSVCVLHVFMPP